MIANIDKVSSECHKAAAKIEKQYPASDISYIFGEYEDIYQEAWVAVLEDRALQMWELEKAALIKLRRKLA